MNESDFMIPENTDTPQPADEPLTSRALLALGLYVIETRARNRDKNLGPWKPVCAFVSEQEAEWYYGRFQSIGYMRILLPNTEVDARRDKWKNEAKPADIRSVLQKLVTACGSVGSEVATSAEWDEAYTEARAVFDSERHSGGIPTQARIKR